jgi:dihydroorotate dehydrogenase (fumarate)
MNFLNDRMDCPIGNGGGTCKTMADIQKLLTSEVAAIEIGSITSKYREGNQGNTFHSGNYFTLNSLGMPNDGENYYEDELPYMIEKIHKAGKKAIVNVAGFNKEEYAELIKLSFDSKADLAVMNGGCPNIWDDGTQKGILSYSLEDLKKTTLHVINENRYEAREGRLGIKLSPIPDSSHIKNIANFLNSFIEVPTQVDFGRIGFIITQNTVPNCYYEEDDTSVISPAGGLAGMSGPGIFPMALGQVRQFHSALNHEIKIIGVGGVTSGKDMRKMIRGGASLVQVASPYYATGDPGVFNFIGAEYLGLKS